MGFIPSALIFFAALSPAEIKLQSLYLMQQNKIDESIDRYREYVDTTGKQDFEMLQQMGLSLLQHGIHEQEHAPFLMTLLGAGLSGSTAALEILEKGIYHPDPQTQLLALHFIAAIEDDKSDEILLQAMSSDYLSTRMEAAFYLSQRKHPHAVGQIEGLMFRLPPVFRPYFPSLFALLGTDDATRSLKRLMEDAEVQVRIESILQVARLGRDDFLPALRKRLTHSHVAELEATVFACGALRDSVSTPKLKRHLSASADTVRIAAALAIAHIGDKSYIPNIQELAKQKNLFAIHALGEMGESEELLASLVKESDFHVRINATVALLQRRDSRCMPSLLEILIPDARDLAFNPLPSPGRTLSYLKAIPSAELRAQDPTIDLSYSLAIREHLLKEAIHLPEPTFLAIVKQLFAKQQNDLLPTTIALLENLQTEEAKKLLREGATNVSAPLLRGYCNLALFRLREEGPFEEAIKKWVVQQKEVELIRFRPILPWKFRLDQQEFSLSPEESSKLLIDSLVAIAARRDEKSISFLLSAIQLGNPINRYALMGLLMKATE